jgi:hypothetical protein
VQTLPKQAQAYDRVEVRQIYRIGRIAEQLAVALDEALAIESPCEIKLHNGEHDRRGRYPEIENAIEAVDVVVSEI